MSCQLYWDFSKKPPQKSGESKLLLATEHRTMADVVLVDCPVRTHYDLVKPESDLGDNDNNHEYNTSPKG
jgi:hypothetical protein